MRCAQSLLLVALSVGLHLASPGVASGQQLNFTHYTVSEGLPANPCAVVHQDRRGYIWFGTHAGVARYDGADFTVYTAADGLPGNSVVTIAEGADGELLFGTAEAGVASWDGSSFRTLAPPADSAFDSVNRAAVGTDGTVWLATPSGAVRLAGDGGSRFTTEDGLPSDEVVTVFSDRGGSVWAGTRDGLAVLVDGRFEAVALGDGGPAAVRAIAQDAEGGLWIGTEAGLFRRRRGRFVRVEAPSSAEPEPGFVGALAAGPGGRLWLATRRGILRYDGREFARIDSSNGLLDDNVRDVMADREGNLWFATDAGVSKLVPGSFVTYTTADGLGDSYARDIAEDEDGRLWVGTRDGVTIVEPDAEPSFRRWDGDLEQVQAVAPLDGDSALVGTGSGLVWRGEARSVRYRTSDGLPSDDVTSLLPVEAGSVWVGTELGVARWTRGGIVDEPAASLVDGRHVVDLELDADGRIWVATRDSGVFRERDGALEPVSSEGGLDDVLIWGMAPGREGGMWTATNGRGAYYVSPDGSVLHLSRRMGLPSDFVWQIVVDDRGRTWLYTNRGLHRWDPEQGFEHFDTRDGLASLEGSADAAIRDRRGGLWFGTSRGLTRFTGAERETRSATAPPLVHIEGMAAGGESVSLRGEVRLPPQRNSVTISYAGLAFRDEASVRYRYRLLGLEEEWSTLTSQRRISYARLPPRGYVFEVEAINGAGLWSTEPARLSFRVAPALYQQNWFRIALAGLFLAAGVILYLRRVGKVERERQRLAGMVEKRTRELVEKNRQLERMATTDELTGLRNRRYFMESLEMELRKLARASEEEALSLLLIDLDDFKALNDRYGHAVGDDVLRQVATRLSDGVRASDIVARYGGEEFAILLPKTTGDGAEFLAEKLRREIAETSLMVDGETTWLTASFGVATMSPPERYAPELAEGLLRRADEAMYAAKAAGKDKVMVAPAGGHPDSGGRIGEGFPGEVDLDDEAAEGVNDEVSDGVS